MAKGWGNFMKDLLGPDDWKKAASGVKNLLSSNESVSSVNPADILKKAQGTSMFGGVPKTVTNMIDNKQNFGEALKNAHSKMDGGEARLSKAAIAGSFMGVSAAHRVATGGGLTKDSKGRSNLIGVPFI